MFSMCKQTRIPTSIEHAIYCYFFNRVEKCLVLAGVNILRVYRLVPTDTTCQPPKTKFECLAQYTLFGNIMCLQSVTLCQNSPEALLLSFSEAKFSLVQYDHDNHNLRTLSLNYFEDDKFKNGTTQHWTPPLIRVDPVGRCVVGLVYGHYFFVLPFGRTIDDHGKSAQVMPSYTIPIKTIDPKMNNIKDFDFLHGYYEPTLLILFESVQTNAGRIVIRKDTCAMVAISLNIQQHVHPVIWSLDSLPYDCQKVIPVSRPIGGALIMAVNSLIHLNQSVPPFGVALNSITNTMTNFPLEQQEEINLVLDRATATFISSNKLVTSLCNGDLYVITLYADSMRAVRSFHFEKCASSVLTTCITVCLDSYLFLGSRLGNSLLLRYYARSQSNDDVPTVKHKNADVTDEDLIELEVYGSEVQTSICLEKYSFEVCDSIINIGPCSQASLGEPAYISDELSNDEHDVELLCTSGHGKNGALSVLHHSIKPQFVATFHLDGYKNMWTVYDENDFHSFMIFTNSDSTLILKTGQEINELDYSGFATQEHTVFVCNMNKYVIQVLKYSVRLLKGSDQIQNIPLEFGSPIIHGSCSSPYAVLLTCDGQVIVLIIKSTGRIVLMRPTNFDTVPPTKTLTVYRDVSGLFSSTMPQAEIPVVGQKLKHATFVTDSMEDEEEMLYGNTRDSSSNETPHKLVSNKNLMWWLKFIEQPTPTYWVVLTRDNGCLEIYTLPDFKIKYQAADIDESPAVLKDSLEEGCFNKSTELIKEILLVPLGYQDKRPLLFVRLNNEVVIYGIHRHPEGTLKMRFHKLTSLLTFQSKSSNSLEDISLLHYFNRIASYNGVFICGQNPHLVLLTIRGELRCHPLHIDGPIVCFAPFHNVNCSQGFLYLNSDNKLRFSILPTHLSYDEPWPLRKVPLRKTPHFIVYHLETKTYCVVTSSTKPSPTYYKFKEDDKELTTEQRDPNFPLPNHDLFTLELFSPVSWEPIPDTSIQTEDWEFITCLKNVALTYEGARSGLKGYIAMGTNYNYSEDITSRGRIFLFDIIDVVPELGKPLTKNKIKMIYAKEQKGPVTAITHVVGFLVTAVGQKIYIWELKDNDLIGIAFIDTEVYVHQMLSIKSLILVADIFKSITLLRFQEEYRTLSLVSRDFKPLEVYDINFLIDNTELGFLSSDKYQNLILFLYQPMNRDSHGGQCLIRHGDINIGSNVNSFFRLRCKQSTLTSERRKALGSDRRHVTMYATLDGSIGYIVPIQEKSYKRLLTLQNMLVQNLTHLAGLNPKAYRSLKATVHNRKNPAKRIIDGDLVWMFVTCMNTRQRNEIANKVGVKTIELLQEIYELDRTTWHF
ncbi:WD40/YVTN repeat-like-containing domain,Cleavage/polyadenylation specificity factor, A [Cinara cedri]|uniref:WD40/YVTN repeat-like-containing domain,Cleavage/polyadenylation specificity factor, A n=1 Tax=Cinara cedri TaxID=506608 RepID=A0A5E4N8H9_9HEMI|nr:WD40/YVTN repeat-like-containing domain,Cleavage/polyadenylation specificity factor, A [Cinara cedri]